MSSLFKNWLSTLHRLVKTEFNLYLSFYIQNHQNIHMKFSYLLLASLVGNVAKKLFTLFIGVICICQAYAQPRQWSTVVYNGTREAWVYLPPGYNSKSEWPVIIFLHGAGERGTDPNDLLVTGLPEYLNGGNDLEAIVICPQIPTTLSTWQPSSITPARDYVINNYNEDQNKMYITGLSLGASGAELYTQTNPSHIAAAIDVSGAYGKTGTSTSKDIPRYFVHGMSDGTQNISNAYLLVDSLNANSPKPVLPPLTSFHWGLGHNSSVWDGKVYADFYPWWRWLNLHDKDIDTTALNYVDSLEISNNWNFYWRTERLVNSLSSSAHKTSLLSRLANVKDIIYPGNSKRVLLELGLSTQTSTGNVNNLTDLSSTSPPYTNLIDDQGMNTGFGFDQVSENAGTEERDYGIRNSYFAGLDEENGYRDSWWIFGNGGTSRFTGLDTNKTYTLRMSGASKALSATEEQGVKITIDAVQKELDNQFYNTSKYIEFTGISPDGSGHIDMLVRSYATTNQWSGYLAFIELVEEGSENILPVSNAGSDQSTTLPDDEVTLTGGGTDEDGTIASYLWTKISGPATYTIVSPSSAITDITDLVEGVYVFRLTVTDNDGGTNDDDIQITVNPAVTIYPVQVNIYGGANPYNNTAWNDWNIGSGTVSNVTSSAFTYSDGTNSGITATLSFSQAIADNGASYGGTMCPPEVLRYTSYSSSNRTLTINDLDGTATYDLEFYASRSSTGNSTVFTIGATSQTVVTDNNLATTVSFSSIAPDVNDKIVVSIARLTGANFQYLNGFKLIRNNSGNRSYVNETTAPESRTTEKLLSVHPNPANQTLRISYRSESKGKVRLMIYDNMGRIVQTKSFVKNDIQVQQYMNIGELRAGLYYINVQERNGEKVLGKFVKQ
jgi:hypothetical protein